MIQYYIKQYYHPIDFMYLVPGRSVSQVELLHIFRTIVFVSVVSAIGASPLNIGVFLLASSRRRNALLSITLR